LHISEKSSNFAGPFKSGRMYYMKKTTFGFVLMLVFASCAGPKQLSYMQDLHDGDIVAAGKISAYKLQAGDQLTIRVSSFDRSAVAPFNVQDAHLNDVPYILDAEGNLLFPGLGAIPAANLTVTELTSRLQEQISEMAKGAVVRVELVGAFVTVLGEVASPGQIRFCPQGITLAEALANVGDLRPNASRRITVLRKQSGGTQTIVVDLTKKDCLASPAWQLLPGDVIYVSPRRGRLLYGRN